MFSLCSSESRNALTGIETKHDAERDHEHQKESESRNALTGIETHVTDFLAQL